MTEKYDKLPSLRSRYLTLAAVVIVLLLIGAIIATWHINNVSRSHDDALRVNKLISSNISELRNSLSRVNLILNTMLIRPEEQHQAIISQNMTHVFRIINVLQQNTEIQSDVLEHNIQRLQSSLNTYNDKIRFLIQQRNKPSWVYPVLPYIGKKLRIPHQDFMTAVTQAINEYTQEGKKIDDTYNTLQHLRYLWQNQILNFRAVMIRFAGLNETILTPQEEQIAVIYSELIQHLEKLRQKQNNDLLSLQAEVSLDSMSKALNSWYSSWQEAQKIRTSSYWRGDIAYLNRHIIPLQKSTSNIMRDLEATALTIANQQTDRLTGAARSISTELWILVLLSITFVVVVYIMIEKLVLQPTVRISQALTDETTEALHLEDKSSLEISRLTSAFNTMRRQIHQRQIALEHQALHDALTSLPNRALLNDRLSQAINLMQRNDEHLAVLLLDLDRFKEVNDTLGHHIGDQLLQLVSSRLQHTIRNSDTVARLGGDEFAIIAPNTPTDDAFQFASKIAAALKDVFTIDHQNIFVGASIGISIYPDHGNDIHTLLRRADTAMYVAKENNIDVALYKPEHEKNSSDNLSLVGDLHHAITQNEDLIIYYHPQIDLQSNEVIQVEALLRWQHMTKGNIPPDEIIRLAEHTGMIKDLSYWVMDTAMTEFMQHLYKRNINLSINLSAWSLQDPDLLQMIEELLIKHRMPAENLTIEITETAMMGDPIQARAVLNELADKGVVIAIDDFGTGFSSLSYLKLLPVKELKIDKSFIFDMLEDENDAIIVYSTIDLAHNLGFKVIAEGVENQETLARLKDKNCDYGQGFFISRPVDIYQFIIWLNNYNSQQQAPTQVQVQAISE